MIAAPVVTFAFDEHKLVNLSMMEKSKRTSRATVPVNELLRSSVFSYGNGLHIHDISFLP